MTQMFLHVVVCLWWHWPSPVCLGAGSVGRKIHVEPLSQLLSSWLERIDTGKDKRQRVIFVRKYYFHRPPLNRLRSGHTRLTHSYLLSSDDLHECGTCQCPLTVKHILVECVDLKDVRNKHFVASSIKDLFHNIEAHKIIDFIKETRFYRQL